MTKILIVEDEEHISNLIAMALSPFGYICETAGDGEKGADMIEQNRYDLILLDVMLPKIDGFELIEYIENYNTPVIFITAKNSVADKVRGLKLGADDYITKPFDVAELQARVETVLRRYNKASQIIKSGNITIDTSSRIVKKNGEVVELTLKEYELLLLFVKNKNIAVEKDGKFYHVDIDKIVHSMIHDDVDSKTHNVLSKFVSIK